jgi:integrase
MPRRTTGSVFKTANGEYGIRWPKGERRPQQIGFKTKTEARRWFAENVAPRLDRGESGLGPEYTLAEFVPLYLDRHAPTVRPRTIAEPRKRLRYATAAFGDVPLRDLERMSGELADWRTTLPEGSRYGVMQALRQALEAAVRYGYMTRNPAKLAGRNPQPPPRPIRAYTVAEVEAIAAELSPMYRPLPMFAAATGLRPEEWQALERRDVDRRTGILNVRRTVSSGEVVELGKTARSLRQVPLSPSALDALDALPSRLDTPLLFPSVRGKLMLLDRFRAREWAPAIEAAGIRRPARIYDLRSTFASNARRLRSRCSSWRGSWARAPR